VFGSNNLVVAGREQENRASYWPLGLEVSPFDIRRDQDIALAFEALKGHAEALYVIADPLASTNRIRINTLALGARLPTMHTVREFVEAGGLMSYGSNWPSQFRRAADFVDKILRGAKPADLPVEQPTKFDLVINLTTAKALGLEVPPSLLARADEVTAASTTVDCSRCATSRQLCWGSPRSVMNARRFIQSPRRRGARDRPGMAPEAFAASMAGAISSLPADPMDRKLQPPCARRILERSQLRRCGGVGSSSDAETFAVKRTDDLFASSSRCRAFASGVNSTGRNEPGSCRARISSCCARTLSCWIRARSVTAADGWTEYGLSQAAVLEKILAGQEPTSGSRSGSGLSAPPP